MSQVCKLANQTVLLVIEAPGGVYNSDQLQLLASFLDEEGLIAKATEDQRLTVAVEESQISMVAEKMATVGLGVRSYREGLHQPAACLGAQCTLHEQDALGDAFRMTSALSNREVPNALRIGLNGCSECCVPIHTLDVSIIGETTGYRLSIGGKNSQIPEMAAFVAEGIPPDQLSGMISKVLDVYQEHAQESETLQEVIERVGSSPFVEVLAPYSQDAADDSDPFGSLLEDEHQSSGSDEELTDLESPVLGDKDFEAELMSDLPDADEFEHETSTEDRSDELSSLDDLDIVADQSFDRDLNDELRVQNDLSDHMVDIDPGEISSGGFDDVVPISEEELAEEFSAELLDSESHALLEDEQIEDFDEGELDGLEVEVMVEENEEDALDQVQTLEPTENVNEVIARAGDVSELDPSDDDFATFDEIDEDAESELEGKIEVSIAEQVTFGTIHDENLEDRRAALEMVTERELDDDNFNLDSFDQDTSLNSDLDELEADYLEDETQSNAPAFTQMQGMSFENGKVRIAFASGATLVIDFNRMKELGGRRKFDIDGQKIDVRIEGDEVFVAVDGVEVNLAIPIAA